MCLSRFTDAVGSQLEKFSQHCVPLRFFGSHAFSRSTVAHLNIKVKLFDFGGMDKRHLPFREIEPEEGNVVVSISYSGTGHAFLVCTAGSQPKVGGCFAVASVRRNLFVFISRLWGLLTRFSPR